MTGNVAARLRRSGLQHLDDVVRARYGAWLRHALPAILIAVLYYAGCLVGFALRFPASGISFFWPPTAILTASLIVTSSRRWPTLLAGAFVAHAIAHTQDGIPWSAWVVQFSGNAVQAVLAAWIVGATSISTSLFADSRRALIFLVGACFVAPAVASLVPAYVYVSLGWASDFAQAWRARAMSNAMAMLTIVPPATVFWRYLSTKPLAIPGRIVEFGTLLLGVVVTQFVVSYITRTNLFGLAAALYAPTPFLLWATVRFGAAGLSFTLLWATLLTIFTALAGHGPLGGTTADTVVGVQLLLTANAIPMVLMAGVLEQSRAEHAALEVSQQRYALATAAGGIGVWDFDVLSGEVRVEGTLKATLGYGGEEIGDALNAWEALIFPADRADVLTRLEAVANGSATTFEAEFRLIHKDGSLRWLLSKGATTDTVDGKPARIRGTYTDITQQKEAARSLNEANEAVVRMGRIASMAEVSASIAHELNQPLAAISANASTGVRWIESGVNLAELHEVLSDISRDSRRASNIVERTHRMFTNHPAQEAPTNLNDIVRTMLAVVDHRLRKLDVQVTVSLDEGLPPIVADPVRLQQVLLNLIVNAADAMHNESGDRRSLSISTRRSKKHVVVSVRDTGKGLDSQTADRMFEPFYTTKSGGTGMGLAISRSIVDSHGGSLWAVANVDRGTTFRFKIPLPSHRASA